MLKEYSSTHLHMILIPLICLQTSLLQPSIAQDVNSAGLDALPQQQYQYQPQQQQQQQECISQHHQQQQECVAQGDLQQQQQQTQQQLLQSSLLDPLQIPVHQQQQQQDTQSQLNQQLQYASYEVPLQNQHQQQQQPSQLIQQVPHQQSQTQLIQQEQPPVQQEVQFQLPQHHEEPQQHQQQQGFDTTQSLLTASEANLTQSSDIPEIVTRATIDTKEETPSIKDKVDPDYVPDDTLEIDEDEELECQKEKEPTSRMELRKSRRTIGSLLKEHEQKDKMTVVKCTECNKKVSSGYLRKHYMKIHKELCDVYKCMFCPWESIEKFEHLSHIRSHTGGKSHVCSECKAAFSRLELLRDHVMKMHKQTKHNCKECGKQFSSIAALRCHKNVIHENKPRHKPKRRPKVCSYCGHVFLLTCDLKAHEMAHRGEKPLKCSQCDLRFTTKSHMKKHELVHTNEKPHVCSYCSFSTNRKANLRNHERIHTGDLPFACDLCEQKFRVKTLLKKHKLKVHSVDLSKEESKHIAGTDLRRKGKDSVVKSVRRTVKGQIKQQQQQEMATKQQQNRSLEISIPTSDTLILEQPPQPVVLGVPLQTLAVPTNILHPSAIASKVLPFPEASTSQADMSQTLSQVVQNTAGSMAQIVVPASSINVSLAENNSYCVQTADGIATLQQTTNLENSAENWMNLFVP